MKTLTIDLGYVAEVLIKLLEIPSPTGYTDQIVHFVGEELTRLNIPYILNRRGAIRADLPGEQTSPDRAVVAHLDTLGAMVKRLKDNGRLQVFPIGNWSSRFAEGARVTIFSDAGLKRGTILPVKASGHTFDTGIDELPVKWENVEVRVDEKISDRNDLYRHGFNVGDYIAVDPYPEITENGFINARFLDNQAGVALVLGAAKAVKEANIKLPVSCHLLFTIAEEVGVGASAGLQRDVAEMVTIDNSLLAQGQNSSEFGVTLAMMDSAGPFDYHLTHKLIDLCRKYSIPHQRDVFQHYRCDSASALTAGNDLRTALVGFGVDASHGYERAHLDSLRSTAELIALYMQTSLTYPRDRMDFGPIDGFPSLPV